jgi:gamma-glutamylcyclotransferase (GGCT)/AIG2-like uncharacterized protein YtfP
MTRVFVYGSLKRAGRHHGELAGATFECEATTMTGHRLVRQGEYPALVRGGDGVVHGEVFVVSEEQLERLDRFEDVPRLYRRTTVLLQDGTHAQAYVIDEEIASRCPTIPSGRWPA